MFLPIEQMCSSTSTWLESLYSTYRWLDGDVVLGDQRCPYYGAGKPLPLPRGRWSRPFWTQPWSCGGGQQKRASVQRFRTSTAREWLPTQLSHFAGSRSCRGPTAPGFRTETVVAVFATDGSMVCWVPLGLLHGWWSRGETLLRFPGSFSWKDALGYFRSRAEDSWWLSPSLSCSRTLHRRRNCTHTVHCTACLLVCTRYSQNLSRIFNCVQGFSPFSAVPQ